jgi:hypothetical protein
MVYLTTLSAAQAIWRRMQEVQNEETKKRHHILATEGIWPD